MKKANKIETSYSTTPKPIVDYDGNLYYGVNRYTNISTGPAGTTQRNWLSPSFGSNSVSSAVDEFRFIRYINAASGAGIPSGKGAFTEVDIRTKQEKVLVTFLTNYNPGIQDGDSEHAKFSGNGVNGLVQGQDGAIYVLDNTNNAIRKVYTR